MPSDPGKTLKNYFIDTKKSGEVLQAFMRSRNISFNRVHKETDIDSDTLRNHLYGRIQKVTMDCVLKILAVTGHTIFEYFTSLFSVEDVHIYDDVISFPCSNDQNDVQVVEVPTPVPEPVAAAPVSVSVEPPEPAIIDAVLSHADRNHVQYIDRVSAHYQEQISMIHTMYEKEITMLEQRHSDSLQYMKDRIEALEKQRDRLTIELITEKRRRQHPRT